MSAYNIEQLRTWIGHDVYDVNNDRIGEIRDLYTDDDTGEPAWFSVATGLFGTRVCLFPVRGAVAEGDALRVGSSKDTIKSAPHVDDDGDISEQDQAQLYEYYGMTRLASTGIQPGEQRQSQVPPISPSETDTPGATDTMGIDRSGRRTERYDSAPTTDDAMTRSEEELDVAKRSTETGRARLRKWVDTEHVQQTDPAAKNASGSSPNPSPT